MIKKYTTSKGTFYEAQTYLKLDPDTGQEIRPHKRGFRTRKEAQKWIDEVRVKGVVEKVVRKKYVDVYELWLESYIYQVRPSTLLKTKGIFEHHILPVVGNMYIDRISAHKVQKLVNEWSTQFVDYRKIAANLKRIFSFAVLHDIITNNPCDKIVMPKVHKKAPAKKMTYSPEELNRFLDACASDKRPVVLPLFRLLAFTGLRRQEVLALTWRDVDFTTGLLNIDKAITLGADKKLIVGETKNASSVRTIALDNETLNILKDWRASSGSGFDLDKTIFDLSIQAPNKMLKQVAKAAGLEPISPHKLRHTHCTISIESGANLKDVQARLGHSDIQTTLNIYAHANTNKHEIINTFADFLKASQA